VIKYCSIEFMMEDYDLLKKSIETKFGQNIVNSRTALALVESITV